MRPWIEKYRPIELENIIIDNVTQKIFTNLIKNQLFPNMLFYGPPGTGKTTTILCLLKRIKDTYGYNNVIHLNASDERGIEVIRNQIYNFIYSKSLFNNTVKFVVLDEVDSMTKQAQQCLLSLIIKSDVMFCLICNYFSKLIPALRDYLLLIPFYNTFKDQEYIKHIIQSENLAIEEEILEDIKYNYFPDIRSCVNCLQIYHSYPFQVIRKKMILKNCDNYNSSEIKEYIKTHSFKEYLFKLFLMMFQYNIDSELVTMMQELIFKPDFEYFDRFFMTRFILLNN
jgi:replication factor C subunit 3/5